jgi:AraC-like DNA-binding protein
MTVRYPRVQSRMILLCLDGRGEVSVDGQRFELTGNTYLALPWNHAIQYRADRLKPFLLCGVHVVPRHSPEVPLVFEVAHGPKHPLSDVPERSDWPLPGPAWPIVGSISGPDDVLARLVRLSVDLFRLGSFDRETSNALGRLLMREVVSRGVERGADRALTTATDELGEAEAWVLDHISEKITLEDLCAHTGMSPSTLRRRFVATVGMPPYEWILGERIRVARELLATTALPVAQVAERAGFADAAYFARIFAMRVGVAPRQYRTRHLRL